MQTTILAALLVVAGTLSIPAQAGNIWPPRYYAMVHPTMFDAMNSIERSAPALQVHVPAALLPQDKAVFDAALVKRLETINSSRAQLGSQVGREVARKILEWRGTNTALRPA